MAKADTGIPEVAVVIPCYRYAHLLPDAIDSVVGQSWPRIQCVIVDDGSPDDTAAVAEELIASHPDRDIRLLRLKNQGLAAARTAGIRASDAQYVLPLDADDKLVPTAVERLVGVLADDPSLSVVCPMGRAFGDSTEPVVTLPVTRRRLLRGNCLVYASMFTRAMFDRVGGYNPNMTWGYEDWDFWLGVLERGGRFAHVPEELFSYRKHGRTMLAEADDRAAWLRARVVLNHPALFSRWRVRLAEKVLAADGRRPRLPVRLGVLATYLLDFKSRLALRQLRSLL